MRCLCWWKQSYIGAGLHEEACVFWAGKSGHHHAYDILGSFLARVAKKSAMASGVGNFWVKFKYLHMVGWQWSDSSYQQPDMNSREALVIC